jgi:hypothetical protein
MLCRISASEITGSTRRLMTESFASGSATPIFKDASGNTLASRLIESNAHPLSWAGGENVVGRRSIVVCDFFHHRQKAAQGLKPGHLSAVAARLKPCPPGSGLDLKQSELPRSQYRVFAD